MQVLYTDPQAQWEVGRLLTLSAWRLGRGIYRIDETVLESLWTTADISRVPTGIFLNLPEYAAYFPTPGLRLRSGQPLLGFFAALDTSTPTPTLHLLLEPLDSELLWLKTDLGDAHSGTDPGRFQGGDPAGSVLITPDFEWTLARCMNVLTYVCSSTGQKDVSRPGETQVRLPDRPAVSRQGGGETLKVARETQVWEVGVRMGRAIRRALQDRVQRPFTGVPGSGTPKRSHMRRHHWHVYHTGPRDQERVSIVKWLPPISVKFDLGTEPLDALQLVVRNVID